MGKRSQAERRVARKNKRADKKLERAQRAASKGNTNKAERLQNKAENLKEKAATLQSQIDGQLIRGLTARVLNVNSIGKTTIRASWNYQSSDLSAYEKLKVSIAPASPFMSKLWRNVQELTTSDTQYDFGPTKNLLYVLKIFGVVAGEQELLDRTFVKKLKI